MKTNKLSLFALCLGFIFVSCQPESEILQTVVDFENVTLTNGVWYGTDNTGSFKTANATFYNSYDSATYDGYTMYFWSGFACSAKTDTITSGYANEFSTMAGSGASNSKQFALAYDSASVSCAADKNGNFKVVSVMLTNSTYAYYDMLNGSAFGKKFATGDWFKVTITGFLQNKEIGKTEYYLADFRNNKTFLSRNWEKVDLSLLGTVDRLSFTFDSSDKFGEWMNTPAYVCIDNIVFEQEITK